MSITAKKLQKPLIVNGQNILPLTSMDQVLTDDEGSRLNETIHQNLAPIELTSTATKAYAVGEFLVYDNLLYRVTSAIALGGTITPGTNCVTDKVGNEIKTIKDALPQYKTLHGGSSITIDYTGYTMIAVIGQYAGNGFIVTAYGSNAPMFLVSTTNVITATNSSSVMTLSNSSTGGFRCGILLFK